MIKINKFRKFLKIFQYVGMVAVLVLGIGLMYLLNKDGQQDFLMTTVFLLGTIILLFVFMLAVLTPLNEKLLRMIINESLSGLVEDVKHSRKKGFSQETFAKFHFLKDNGNSYGCTDYYSFKYKDENYESCTITVSNQYKVKRKKVNEKLFLGRVYVIPYNSEQRFLVLGKKKPNESRKKDMDKIGYKEYPLKFKKHTDNFEVFYKGEKPTCNVQDFIEKLLSLKIQGKCPVSCSVRKTSLVLALNSNRYYQEVELKKDIDIGLVKEYRKDVQIVLNFIDALKTVEE